MEKERRAEVARRACRDLELARKIRVIRKITGRGEFRGLCEYCDRFAELKNNGDSPAILPIHWPIS